MEHIIIKQCDKGLGVFANKDFESGEIIEICNTIKSVLTEIIHGNNDENDYVYAFDDNYVILLGFGSIYNHSFNPNAIYIRDLKNKTMMYAALTHINKGDEIMVNYNGDIYCKDKLWFENI